jgi:hypothetical protein
MQAYKMASQSGDERGMTEARNLLENKGFLSKNFGIGGRYNTPYNKDAPEQSKSQTVSQPLVAQLTSGKLDSLNKDRSIYEQELARVEQTKIDKIKNGNWETPEDAIKRDNMENTAGVLGLSGIPMRGTNKDLRSSERAVGAASIPYDAPMSRKERREAKTVDNYKKLTDKKINDLLVNQDISGDEAVALKQEMVETDKLIAQEKEAIQKRNELAPKMTKQEKGFSRQNWKELRMGGLSKFPPEYTHGDIRNTYVTTATDAINSANSYRDKLKIMNELNSNLQVTDTHFNRRPALLSAKDLGIEKPKVGGGKGGGKLTDYYVTDANTGEAIVVKVHANKPMTSSANKALIKDQLGEAKYDYDSTIYSRLKPLGKSSKGASNQDIKKLAEEDEYQVKQLIKEAGEPFLDTSKKKRADDIFKRTGVRLKVHDNGDVTLVSRGRKPLTKGIIGYKKRGSNSGIDFGNVANN